MNVRMGNQKKWKNFDNINNKHNCHTITSANENVLVCIILFCATSFKRSNFLNFVSFK